MAGKALRKRLEAIIRIDVVDDDHAVWRQRCPGAIQFEAYVALAVKAVVNEEIDLAEAGKQVREGAAGWNP